MKIKEIKATGKYVVIKVKEVAMSIETKTKSGIILQTENTDGQKINNKTNTGKVRGKFIIDSIGPDVDLDKMGFKIGDEVIINDYDDQTNDDKENNYV